MYFNFTSFIILLGSYAYLLFEGASSSGSRAIMTSVLGVGFSYCLLKGIDWAMTTRVIDSQPENIFDSALKTRWMRIRQRTIYGHKGLLKTLKRETKKPGSVRVGTRFKWSLGAQLVLNLLHERKDFSQEEMNKILDMLEKSAFVSFSAYAHTLLSLYQKPGLDYLTARILSVLEDPRLSYKDLQDGRTMLYKLGPGGDQELIDYAREKGNSVVKTAVAICRYANDPELKYSSEVQAVTLEDEEVQEIFRTLVLDKKYLDKHSLLDLLATSKALSG